MWASSGTAAAKACGSPAIRAPVERRLDRPDHELGGDRRRRAVGAGLAARRCRSPARSARRPRRACAGRGRRPRGPRPAGRGRASGRCSAKRASSSSPARSPGRQPLLRLGRVRGPSRRAARSRLVGRRVAVGLAGEVAVELDPVAAVAVDHVLDGDPAGSPSPRRPRASPRGCRRRISSACRSRLSRIRVSSPRGVPDRFQSHAARPPYVENDSASN